MEPWWTPSFAGCSCKEFLPRTTESCLLLREDRTSQRIWPKIPKDWSFWRIPACATLLKALEISGATARVSSDLVKTPAVLSDKYIRRLAVDWEDLKPYWNTEKKATFL